MLDLAGSVAYFICTFTQPFHLVIYNQYVIVVKIVSLSGTGVAKSLDG
jgi:hypothetical protein